MLPFFRFNRDLSRGALALALLATAGAVTHSPALAAAKDKKAQAAPAAAKVVYSKPFIAAAAPLEKALDAAKKRADVIAAQQNVTTATNALNAAQGAARTAAQTQRDAAIAALGATLTAEKAMLETSYAAVLGADDKFKIGNMALNLGGLAMDTKIQRRGLETMLESGKTNPSDVPRLNFFLGQFAFDVKDYAKARASLQAAIDGGFTTNDAAVLLAETYLADNQFVIGLDKLKSAIDARGAAGTPAPENWFRRGLSIAYRNKMMDKAAVFSSGLVQAYPTKDNWAGAISVVRLVGKYELQDRLDLMRLMQRTHSFTEGTDYAEFIQAADPRRLPAEVLSVLDEGLKAGKLEAGDMFVTDAKMSAAARIKEDQPSLPTLEKTAMAPTATGNSIGATADALLSYSMPVKAESLYRLALQKGGVDVQRINTRLAIALFDQGKFADAKVVFDQITGIRQPIAQLWSIHSAQKANGG